MTSRTTSLFRHHDLATPLVLRTSRLQSPVPRRLPFFGRLSPNERTLVQMAAGLVLGSAGSWTVDHALQLLRAVL